MRSVLLIAMAIFGCGSLYGQQVQSIQVQVQKAVSGGAVKLLVTNESDQIAHIWGYSGNSWGWGIWTFEFFNGKDLTIFVRRPDEAFTVNFPHPLEIPAKDSLEQSFDLNDGTWVTHHLPIFPTYSDEESKRNAMNGCVAILSIPNSRESKQYGIWTGMVASQALVAPASKVYSPPVRTGLDRFTDEETAEALDTLMVDIHWNSVTVQSCLQDLEAKFRQLDPQHPQIKFTLFRSLASTKIDITLDHVPVSDVCGFLAVQAGCKYVIRKNAVVFMPSDTKIDPVTGSWH